jgi:hypothetical protein
LIFDVKFFLFSIAVVKITFIFYCSVYLRANISGGNWVIEVDSIGSAIIILKYSLYLK